MKKQQKKSEKQKPPVYMMNRELSWLKFNERVLNEAGNPRVPLAERLTFASIYQSNLDEFYRVRVGTLMDQMESSEVIRENKTNMTSEEQVKAILAATRELDQKKAAIYEQLMGELEPYGIRLINFNRLSEKEGKLLETYFDQEIAPYLSANIVSKQQPFPFLKNKSIYAVASLMTKGGKTKTAIIPCSNTVFKRLIDIPTRKGTFMLSEELILHFLPKMFKNYEIKEKSLIRITRNADIDTETIYDEDLDYRDAMENLIKQRRRMNPVRMELSRELNKKMISSLCKELHVDKEHVFLSRVPLDMSFVFGIQSYLKNTAQEKLFYQRRTPRMTPQLDDKSPLIPQILKKDVLLSYPFENIKSFINLLEESAKDESVVSIKMTLYRLADKSQIVDALVEAAEVFAALLKGKVVEKSNLLLVAPKCLQNRVLDMIQEEIDQVKQGKEGYIGIKINSLTDKVIINKLVEASQAGVKIEMVVRGICCLIPEIKGYTENIKVVSIVGRYLEHSRIYRFGTKEREKIYIASADFMTRNTVRRVEVAAPVLDEKLKERLDWMFATMMNDDEKGKRLTETGNYADRNLNDVRLNSQEIFYAMAYSNAEKMQKKEKSEK